MSQQSRRKISASFISLLFLLHVNTLEAQQEEQNKDSVEIPLSIRAGIDVISPVIYLIDKDILSTEVYLSVDMNEKYGVFLGGGVSDYKYSQYNYDYQNKGFYFKTGIDFNLLKPQVSQGKYWGGIGVRYGISSFNSEIPSLTYENYWGSFTSSVGRQKNWGHYLEISPGFRAKIFANFSMGWSVNIRRLLYTGTGKDLRPIYFPGFGAGGQTFSTGISYFLSWNFRYKKIMVKTRVDEEPAAEEVQDTAQPQISR